MMCICLFFSCFRWGYANLSVLEEVVANYSSVGLPLETVWSDIDFLSTKFWTMEFDERESFIAVSYCGCCL